MRVFRATYKDRKGKTREASSWYVEIKHKDTIRRVPAFTDKAASAEFGRKLERLSECREAGQTPPPELSRWIEELPAKTRATLARIKLLDPRRLAASKSIKDHVEDFRRSLVAKGSSEAHAEQTAKRVQVVADACGVSFYSDIEGDKVQSKLQEMREAASPISIKTSNYYLGALKHFCRWMVRERRASESPLEHLRPLNARLDENRRERRALTIEEQRRLIEATTSAPDRFGMTGPERAMLYRVALETGLRAGELRSLRAQSFDFESTPPTVTVEAAYSKRRREDRLYLKAETARALAGFLRATLPAALAFRMPHAVKVVDMIRADLTTAGIEHATEEGVVDFHALRHSFITSLTRAKVDPRTIQTLARHSTITLTMDRYAHSARSDEVAGIQRLPDLSMPTLSLRTANGAATGTDGAPVLADCLASKGGSSSTSTDFGGQTRTRQGQSTARAAPSGGIANPLFPGSNPGAASSSLDAGKQGVSSIEGAAGIDDAHERLGVLLGVLEQEQPGLAMVVRAWSGLAEPMRMAVLALVAASTRIRPDPR